MSELLFSGAILTAFLGGVVALFAPCCISVMLPAYFAGSFHRRSQLVAMTLVFAAGIATIIIPIGLGASVISRLLVTDHHWIFAVGGIAMLIGGVAMIAGWKFMLPMPGRRENGGRGVGATYSLGVFSGAASACCAPVLAGVATLAGAAGSFPIALAIGTAYVFGMVAPLAALALLWDKRDWGSTRLFGGWGVTLRVGRWRHRVAGPSLLAGGMLAGMGILTIALAVRGPSMALTGWRLSFTAWLNHIAAVIEHHLRWLPGWAGLLILAAALTSLVLAAQRHRDDTDDGSSADLDTASSSVDESQPAVLVSTEGKH